MYERILVAVDGSDTSNRALDEAIKLTSAFKSHLRVINIAEEYLGYIDGVGIDIEKYTQTIRQYGELILEKVTQRAEAAGVATETEFIEITDRPDHITDKIIEDANKYKADLVVLGTHGRKGFSRLVLGSVAEAVIRNISLPVLLVPAVKA